MLRIDLDKDATIKVLNTVYDYAIATLENFKSVQLSDTVSFFIRPMNKLQILNLLNGHQTITGRSWWSICGSMVSSLPIMSAGDTEKIILHTGGIALKDIRWCFYKHPAR